MTLPISCTWNWEPLKLFGYMRPGNLLAIAQKYDSPVSSPICASTIMHGHTRSGSSLPGICISITQMDLHSLYYNASLTFENGYQHFDVFKSSISMCLNRRTRYEELYGDSFEYRLLREKSVTLLIFASPSFVGKELAVAKPLSSCEHALCSVARRR